MTTFDGREKGSENKFGHDSELDFKIAARRNRLIGEWAAEQMGYKGDKVTEYSKSVVEADFQEPGAEDVIRKILEDFEKAGVQIDDYDVRAELKRLTEVAKKQIISE